MFNEETALGELQYAERSRKEAKEFFVGKDVAATEDIVIRHGESGAFLSMPTFVSFGKEHLPAVSNIERGIKHLLQVSTRSTLAQCGIEVRVDWDQFGEDGWAELRDGKSSKVPITIFNYGLSDISIKKGDAMFRFFFPSEPRLERSDLAEALKRGDIRVSGIYGTDWWVEDSEGAKLAEDRMDAGARIVMAFDPLRRFMLPRSNSPVRYADKKHVAEKLEPLPADAESKFYITETNSRISLGNGIFGVIVTDPHPATGQKHIESSLIDAHWDSTVKLEIVDPIDLPSSTSTISINFFPQEGKPEASV